MIENSYVVDGNAEIWYVGTMKSEEKDFVKPRYHEQRTPSSIYITDAAYKSNQLVIDHRKFDIELSRVTIENLSSLDISVIIVLCYDLYYYVQFVTKNFNVK